ncbi:MAG: FAD-dependent thymidylate synthase, partial [Thermomicrobiales bacterium]
MTIEQFYRLWHEGTSHPIRKRKPLFLERVVAERRYTVPELAGLIERRAEDLRNLVREGKLAATREAGRIIIQGSAWHDYARRQYTARVPMRDRLARMRLRMCDEQTGEIRHTHVTDIWQTGVKPVFKVTLANGKTLTMTKDHRCLTDRGWMTLEQATGLRLTEQGGVTWHNDAPAFATNGVPAHQSAEWLGACRRSGYDVRAMADEAGVSYHTIRKWLRAHGLGFTAWEKAQLAGLAQRGQRRTVGRPRVFTEEQLTAIRVARSGPRSNFWKGGITPERANIARWTKEQAPRVHARNNYRCIICGGKENLHAHHLDPVWHNPAQARDQANLTSLCQPCHTNLHRRNLDLLLLDAVTTNADLTTFWTDRPAIAARPASKPAPKPTRLFRQWSNIARIEYAGETMTYDLAVAGPYHNFVANGFIVHNSVNEVSARYSILPEELYLPDDTQISFQSADNKQGRSAATVPSELKARVRELLLAGQHAAYAGYQEMLDAEIARELARVALPVSVYTEWYWKINLHNLFHFLEL